MDPFSAATGVAGLISLGIEVCKGLNAYCQDYRSKDSEILAIGQHANELRAFLYLIESRMKGNSQVDQSLATTFENCHATCTLCLQDFAALNTKYTRPKAVSGFRKQGKAFVRQLQFPFHKDKFDGLKSQMLEFQNALSSCLLLLNYDRTTEILHTTVSEAANISSAIVLQSHRTTDQISLLLPQIEKSIDDRLSKFEKLALARSESRGKQTANVYIHGQDAATPMDDWRGFRSDDNPFDHDRQSTESSTSGADPAIRTFAMRNEQLDEKKLSAFLNFSCNCKHGTSISQVGSRHPDVLEHKEGCLASFLNKRSQKISGEIRFLSTLFRWKVSIRYSQFFLRDLQVHPNFTVTAIVPRSPAFKLMDTSLQEITGEMTRMQVEGKLLALSKRLRELFMDRKAWPTDISPTDQNLLHRACVHFNSNWPEDTAYLFVQLLSVLVSMGVPMNGSGHCGTPLRWFMWSRSEFRPRELQTSMIGYNKTSSIVAREMTSLDAYYAENPDSELYQDRAFSGTRALSELFPYIGDTLHCFEYGELSSALIRRSEADVRRLLGQPSDYIYERGHQGQTPLHISAGWPQGLNILFELAGELCRSIINTVESTGIAPINCAIHLHQTESIIILLKHGAAIDLEDTSVFFPTDGNEQADPQTKEVCDLLAAILADRRQKLLQHALMQLPESDVVRFDLRDMSMLQHNAFEVVETMKSHGIQLPVICGSVRQGSIYHSKEMDATLAEALFEAGFSVADSCWNGYAPLLMYRFRNLSQAVQLISWFHQKQADLLATVPDTLILPSIMSRLGSLQFRVIHRLASTLGYHTLDPRPREFDPSVDPFHYRVLIRRILSEVSLDPCQCYCAPEGCDPTTVFTKTYLRYHVGWSYWTTHELDTVLEIMSEQQEHVKAAFVRVCTFERLGMRHTCCVHNSLLDDTESHISRRSQEPLDRLDRLEPIIELMDHLEAEEIREEDTYLAENLEELMIEFKPRLRDSFRDFWKWWIERMDEVDEEDDTIPDEDIQAMVDIGVRLEI